MSAPHPVTLPPPDPDPAEVLRAMHAAVYRHAAETLCGDSQILARLHAFWEYIDIDRKQKKAIMKATSLPRYREAVSGCRPTGNAF